MTFTVLSAGGAPVGGGMAPPSEVGAMPAHWGAYVTVTDVDATAKEAVELGDSLKFPPLDNPGVGRFCMIRDPRGAHCYAITYPGPASAEGEGKG
jgi:hypothetical protein